MSSLKPAIVGIFVIGGAALGVIAILLFGGSTLFSPTVHAVVYFKGSVANLDVGAPVTFRGVRVGNVTSVSVSLNMTDLTAQIPVFIDLNPNLISLRNFGAEKNAANFDRLLKAGLKAQLTMQSIITGQLLVDLDILPNAPTILVGSDSGRTEIPSIPSRLQTLETELAELPLKEMADNANQAMAAIRQVTVALAPRIIPLSDSLMTSSAVATATLHDVDSLAIAGQSQITIDGDAIKHVLDSTERTLDSVNHLVNSLSGMTAADSSLRSDLEATARDLASSASSLRGFTHTIERNPSSLLSGKPTP